MHSNKSKHQLPNSILMDFLLTFLIPIIIIISILWICSFGLSRARKLPPGPLGIPIIGNMLQLGPKPHESLTKLSKKYGPLMSLKLGNRVTIVASSPEMAKMVLQKHDIALCGRTLPSPVKYVQHDKHSVVWLSADTEWRKLRKICKEQLFSAQKLDGSHGMRTEKLQKLLDYLRECSQTGRAVDIGIAAFTTTVNLISATLFSVEFAHDAAEDIKEAVWAIQVAFGSPNLASFFPFLEAVDPQGISRKLKPQWDKLSVIFDGIIDDKLKCRGQLKSSNNLLEALIEETDLSRDGIKHLLMDLFVAGTDTSATTVEWAMAELLRQPDKMSKARAEVRQVIAENGKVEESDIRNLPYLEAIVKETLRLHPPVPFLLPHKAESDVEINGFLIPKNAEILTNVWAIGRDSSMWTDAEVFMPERFMNGKTDFRGKDFELIPFGSGRRICPGIPLASHMVHLMIATFVGYFEWELDEGMKPEELDMNDKSALTLPKAIPLKAVPIKL